MTRLNDSEMLVADHLLRADDANVHQILTKELSRWDSERFLDGLVSLQKRGLVAFSGEGRTMRASLAGALGVA